MSIAGIENHDYFIIQSADDFDAKRMQGRDEHFDGKSQQRVRCTIWVGLFEHWVTTGFNAASAAAAVVHDAVPDNVPSACWATHAAVAEHMIADSWVIAIRCVREVLNLSGILRVDKFGDQE